MKRSGWWFQVPNEVHAAYLNFISSVRRRKSYTFSLDMKDIVPSLSCLGAD